MDHYEEAQEKLKDVEAKRENVDLDDFEEFMRKVEEVNKMVHALTSNDKSEVEEATKNVDVWLKNRKKQKRNEKDMVEEIINDPSANKRIDKTVINKNAFKETKPKEESLNNLNSETMSQEAFMKSVEEDAKQRSEDRKQRKKESDAIKAEAKIAFSLEDYEKALDLYNKAINVRKDSCVLYTNRALTLLNLGLFSRAVTDCESALTLNENSFKPALFKAKAYFQMGDEDNLKEWMTEVRKMFPHRIQEIEEGTQNWVLTPAKRFASFRTSGILSGFTNTSSVSHIATEDACSSEACETFGREYEKSWKCDSDD